MKRTLLLITVTLALATVNRAGDIPSGGSPSPTPPGSGTPTQSSSTIDDAREALANQFSTEALSALLAVIGMVS